MLRDGERQARDRHRLERDADRRQHAGEAQRELAAIVGGWIDGCAAAGFDAVEIDNLDTLLALGRPAHRGRRGRDDGAVRRRRARRRACAIAQKNSAELVPRNAPRWAPTSWSPRSATATASATPTRAAYGDHVLVIEYRRRDFTPGCTAYPDLSIVLRDLDLVTPADKGYVYGSC